MKSSSILGHWYAEPLTTVQAECLLDENTKRLELRLRHGGNTLCFRLAQMQAKFWMGKPIGEHYQLLRHIAGRSVHGKALLELIYGQLLASRSLGGAKEHLQYGFELARPLFNPADYFTVLERHRLIGLLPFSDSPAPPQSLQQLLTTARVMERMLRPDRQRGSYHHDKNDTYG